MINPVIDEYGNKQWYDSGGYYHRDGGPAIICANGAKYWYQHDMRHRDDGPAIIASNGENYWYLNDRYLSFDEWLHEVDMSDEAKVMMKLQHG